MIESSRRHGAFDTRYPDKHLSLSATPANPTRYTSEELACHLDWQAFLARFFPSHPRHALQALAPYGEYRVAAAQS
jgi:hypothetical protein